jgi:AcrR family transcriptional regulator
VKNDIALEGSASKENLPKVERRTYDAEQTKRELLEVATEEFAAMGLNGARVDEIADRTRTSKRMIYYYFGSKEGLYLAVLEKAYSDIREVEKTLSLENLDPVAAIRKLVSFTFDYHDAHPEFVRLVSIENIHCAAYLKTSDSIKTRNLSVIKTIEDILKAGVEAGVFRSGVDPIDLHMLISGFCFHRVSNHYTFGTIFGRDPMSPDLKSRHRRMIADAICAYLEK